MKNPKITIPFLLLLLCASAETTGASLATSSATPTGSLKIESRVRLSEVEAQSTAHVTLSEVEGIWPFKPKYNKRKIQRQNTPRKVNKRNKRRLRKMGMAFIHIEMEVNHV